MIKLQDWWKATKKHSTSPLGSVQTNLIITFFIAFGCLFGSIQVKINNGLSGIAFMLFGFAALNFYNMFLLLKQYKAIKRQIDTMRFIQKQKEATINESN
jgi:hypothetical protein